MTNTQTRFDARLPLDQKMYFEKAAKLGGYRNLTEFIVMTVQEKAKEIINEKEKVLSSDRDAQLFFEAIINDQMPSETLKKALIDYNELVKK